MVWGERRTTTPFVTALWLRHSIIILFISKDLLSSTNEKRDDEGINEQECTQTEERCKPNKQRNEYGTCWKVLHQIPCNYAGDRNSCYCDDCPIGVRFRARHCARRFLPQTYYSGGHSIGEKLFHISLFLSDKQWGSKTRKPLSSVVEIQMQEAYDK